MRPGWAGTVFDVPVCPSSSPGGRLERVVPCRFGLTHGSESSDSFRDEDVEEVSRESN